MSVSISALRSRRLLPGVAFLVAFFFLTGQFFNCCLINESFGKALKRVFHSSSHSHEGALVHSDSDEDEGAHCHMHAGHDHPEAIAGSEQQARAEGGPHFQNVEHCLSEQSFRGKPMLASEIAATHVPLFLVHVLAEVPAPLPFVFERPRPQNKSSPPLYLTTLRILV